jgi:glycosyltransferase involved in cell wall biosynthesis
MAHKVSDDRHSKTLILITNHFPFGMAEAFLEPEIEHLKKEFDKIIILARDVTSELIRKADPDYTVVRVNPESSLGEKIQTCFLYLKYSTIALSLIREEFNFLKSKKKEASWSVWKIMIHDLTKAITTSYHINKIITRNSVRGKLFLYSYWLTSSALATIFVGSGPGLVIKRISRAHGGDIYDYRNNLQYLSFRATLIKQLHRIFSVSQNGQQYLLRNVNTADASKISVSRLGVRPAVQLPKKGTSTFCLVSCSFLVPVKQVHLIIESLVNIQNFELEWIHIGDGPLKSELELLAEKKLSDKKNIRYNFLGSKPNEELMRFYQEKYVDLFINTSSSEGIPVTMMEAQSYGIPIVAKDVGGIKEIVSDKNGILLPADAGPQDIAAVIERIQGLAQMEYQRLRANSFQTWKDNYNAERNFSTFVAEILNL